MYVSPKLAEPPSAYSAQARTFQRDPSHRQPGDRSAACSAHYPHPEAPPTRGDPHEQSARAATLIHTCATPQLYIVPQLPADPAPDQVAAPSRSSSHPRRWRENDALHRHRRGNGGHPHRDQAAARPASTTSRSTRRRTASAARGARTPTRVIACDVPSHFYSYSFALNPEWSHRFAPGAEIHAYFEDVARRFGVDSRIRYGKEVTRCEFAGGRWQIALTDGSPTRRTSSSPRPACCTTRRIPTSRASSPSRARAFHSARWNHDVALAGKRVGVVGTGSSRDPDRRRAGRPRWRELTLFQRTAAVDHADRATRRTPRRRRPRSAADPEAIAQSAPRSRTFTDDFANHPVRR